jgi:thioredoxin-related protein
VRYRGLSAALVAILATIALSNSGRAARNPGAAQPSGMLQELIVLEVPNCTYCAVFRRDVLPNYQRSKLASELPIRFLDLNDPAADQLKLASSVTIVPTIVIMREGSEAARMSGYMGNEAFFQSIKRFLGEAN